MKMSMSFPCDKCGKIYTRLENLNIHKNSKHNKRVNTYTCELCNKVYLYKTSLKNHINKTHRQGPFIKCSLCTFTSFTGDTYKTHLFSSHRIGKGNVKCVLCKKTFRSRQLMRDHIKIYHKCKRISYCNDCKKAFSTKHLLDEHIKDNHFKQFKCDKCELKFNSKYLLRNHREIEHNPNPTIHRCHFCDYSNVVKYLVTRHETTCSNKCMLKITYMKEEEVNHNCDLCGDDFSSINDLIVHRDFRHGVIPYDFMNMYFISI